MPTLSRWIDSSGWKLTISQIHQRQPKLVPKTWRFDLYQRPSSEAGTGETGRKFGVRLQEHRTEVEFKPGCTVTSSLRASSLTEHNKSAHSHTDHATEENHIINWSQVTMIDREPERLSRWIKEAIHFRKEGQQAMNGDDGSYPLSHAYDHFLDTASSRRVKNRKNWVPASSDECL